MQEDQPVVDMMTDKATVEMESPVRGTVIEIAGAAGARIAIGAILMVIETAETGAGREAVRGSAPVHDVSNETILPEITDVIITEGSGQVRKHILAAPTVRARAEALGVDLADVHVAEGVRVRHADLDAFLMYHPQLGYQPAAPTRPDETIKIIGVRRLIAENMAASKRHIPHFSYVDEVNVTKLEDVRADLNASRGTKPKLTLLPLLIVALCKALPDFPMMNARFDDEAGIVTRHGAVHLGLATQTEAGLMVPVIRDAQSKNIWQLAAEIKRLAEAARSSTLKPAELSGSTLTLTSLGHLGGIATAPVINRPEVAIIAPNRIIERPIFAGDKIIRAKMMNISMSCDHRVIDGWDAAHFIQAVRTLLETPVLLFANE